MWKSLQRNGFGTILAGAMAITASTAAPAGNGTVRMPTAAAGDLGVRRIADG